MPTPETSTIDEATDNPSAAKAPSERTAKKSGDAIEPRVQTPEFSPLHDMAKGGNPNAIGRFYDVDVTIWAELGQAKLPLKELLKLSEGSVIELGRPINEPIDLMAQGVRIARGEVVIVDDCFAIRIKEIESPNDDE